MISQLPRPCATAIMWFNSNLSLITISKKKNKIEMNSDFILKTEYEPVIIYDLPTKYCEPL